MEEEAAEYWYDEEEGADLDLLEGDIDSFWTALSSSKEGMESTPNMKLAVATAHAWGTRSISDSCMETGASFSTSTIWSTSFSKLGETVQ